MCVYVSVMKRLVVEVGVSRECLCNVCVVSLLCFCEVLYDWTCSDMDCLCCL